MNREILFRGMDENGNWHEGDLSTIFGKILISNEFGTWPIEKEIIGQFTGLYDSTEWEDATDKQREYAFIACDRAINASNAPEPEQIEPKDFWRGVKIFEGQKVKDEIGDIYTIVYHKESCSFRLLSNNKFHLSFDKYTSLVVIEDV